MNVRELRDLLSGAEDETAVVVPAFDHSYRLADARIDTAIFERRDWSEDFGERLEKGQQRRKVLVIGG